MTGRLASMIVQLVGIPALLAICGWLALSVNSLQIQMGKVEIQIMERTSDVYTNASAARDRQFLAIQVESLDRRVTRLETAPVTP